MSASITEPKLLAADLEATILRELLRWDGVDELSGVAPMIARSLRRPLLTHRGIQ